MTLEQLRAKRNEAAGKMKALADVEASGAALTDAQADEFDAAYKEVGALDAQVKRAEAMHGVQARLDEPRPSPGARQVAELQGGPVHPGGPEAKQEFSSFGEFIHAAVMNRGDQRLDFKAVDHEMGTGSTGGFAVPTQFRGQLLSVESAGAVVRPRALVIPAGSPPDSAITMPALDQGSDANMFGGVAFSWIGEGAAKPQTNFAMKEVSLQPHEIAGHAVVTDKLLRNWDAFSSVLSTLFGRAMSAALDAAYINGNGVAKPKGFVGSPCVLDVARTEAGKILYADLVEMETKMLPGAMPIWLTTKRAVGQLRKLKDEADQLIWSGKDANTGPSGNLMGYPVVVVPRMPALGVRGDIMLVDLSYYLIKDGSGPFIASSEHVHFVNNKTVVKIFTNTDGKCWLNAPITEENGDTHSPFVALDVYSA